MGRLMQSPRREIFFGKRDFLKRRPKKNSQKEFLNGKCAFHLLVSTGSRPFGLDCLRSYLPRESLRNGTSA